MSLFNVSFCPLVLFVSAAEYVSAVAPGDEIEIFGRGWIKGRQNRSSAGVADRAGRQPAVSIGVERGYHLQIGVGQTPFVYSECIFDGGARLEPAI